VLFVLAAGR